MKKLLVLNVNGVNWYVKVGYKTINATIEDVNIDNIEDVSNITDIDVITSSQKINNIEDLEIKVFEKIACDNIWDKLPNIVNNLISEQIDMNKLCCTLESNVGIRENKILALLDSVELEGTNILNIYSIEGEGFSIDLRPNTLGHIVG